MRGIRQDPCKGCGRTIEHDGEPFEVYCDLCEPPTTEWRRAPKVVCRHCIFMMGLIAGIALMALFR